MKNEMKNGEFFVNEINKYLDENCVLCWNKDATLLEKIQGMDNMIRRYIYKEKTIKDKRIEELEYMIKQLSPPCHTIERIEKLSRYITEELDAISRGD